MKPVLVTAGTAFLLVSLVGIGGALAQATAPANGRAAVKTSIAADAPKRTILLVALLDLKDVPGVSRNDPRFANARIAGFDNPAHLEEGDLVTTTGWIHVVAATPGGGYQIQISASRESGAPCMIAEVPAAGPARIGSARLREDAARIREWIRARLFRGGDASPRGSVMTHPVYVTITGQLFYDDAYVGEPPRGKKNMKASTLWELNPVTGLAFAPLP